MKKNVTKTITEVQVEENSSLLDVIIEQSKPVSLLDTVSNQEIGSSKEEVYTYNITGYLRLVGVSPTGKCGSEDLEGSNYSVEISTYSPVKNVDGIVYGIAGEFAQMKNGKYWKASCEEIANFMVKQIVKTLSSNVAEIIVNMMPNEFTKVTTLWQDHMPLPEDKYVATPKFNEKPEVRSWVGCGSR